MKWKEQKEKKIQAAQQVKEQQIEVLRKKANKPLGGRKIKVEAPKGYVSVVHEYDKSLKEYRDNRKWREEMSRQPLDKSVYTFKPKLSSNSKLLSQESEYCDQARYVEDRLLERGRISQEKKEERR